MRYSLMRDTILSLGKLHDALNLLVGEDHELRRHLESLLISEWENGYQTGYNQAQVDQTNDGWSKHESHV